MLSKLKDRLSSVWIGVLIAAVAIAGAVAIPATAEPIATASNAVAKQVRQALKLGQVANKRSINAVKVSRVALQRAGQGGQGEPGPQGPKGDTGARGPRGPQGPAGEDGQDGQDGQNGQDGQDGQDGTSVTITPLDPGDENCEAGGAEFTGQGGPAYACNGAGGSSSPTQTGAWAFIEPANQTLVRESASFISPLETGLSGANTHAIPVGGPVPEECADEDGPGSVSDPKAMPGHFCVYAGQLSNAAYGPQTPFAPIASPANPGGEGTGVSGAILTFMTTAANASGAGTWALTAPE